METIALAIGFLGILAFLYFHTKSERTYIEKMQNDLTNLPIDLQKFYVEISQEKEKQTIKTVGESFKLYLKHIERLEKMVLPKPVTTKEVQKVMDRIGEVTDAGAFKNDIEDADKGVELPKDDWTGLINTDTKVAFEEEDLPVVVEN